MTCAGAVYPAHWLLRYNSDVLRHSNFDKFEQLLDNERYQARKAKELLRSGLLGPEAAEIMASIRYVLDLGPSGDNDLRSEHLEALSLPKGIVRYSTMAKAMTDYCVPVSAAGGHDDACCCFHMKIAAARDGPASPVSASASAGTTLSGVAEGPRNGSNAAGVAVATSEAAQSTTDGAGTGELHVAVPETPTASENAEGVNVPLLDDPSPDNIVPPPPSPIRSSPPGLGFGNIRPSPPAPAVRRATSSTPSSIWDVPMSPELCIDDYCEIRHAANVIRLLRAMAGGPLLLNSAARVYSIAGIAKLFGLQCSDGYVPSSPEFFEGKDTFAARLRSTVQSWFSTANNSLIIDLLPEECFVMAWNLKLPDILRVAYRILVAEKALKNAGETGSQPRTYQSRQEMVFGRELSGLLDEDMETILDHASEALIHRVTKLRNQLVGVPMGSSGADTIIAPTDVGAAWAHNKDAPYGQPLVDPLDALSRLRGAGAVLDDLVHRERELVLKSYPGMAANNDKETFPIAAAASAVQELLDRLSTVFGVVKMKDTSLGQFSNRSFVALYVRKALLKARPFDLRYDHLPASQKCLTAMFWNDLRRSSERKMDNRLKALHFTELVAKVNARLYQLLRFHLTTDADPERLRLHADLVAGLNCANLWEAGRFGPPQSEMYIFSGHDIRCSMYDLAASQCKELSEVSHFSPPFELPNATLSPHLILGLSADEFRFLPLWAGGNNDGTGAVFEAPLPTAHLGPISPGPTYRTGTTDASASSVGGGCDAALSGVGPPSARSSQIGVNDAGTERLTDAAMSDASGPVASSSIASSGVLVQNFGELDLDRERLPKPVAGRSAARGNTAGDDSLSSHASLAANDGQSSVTGAHTSIATPSTSSVSAASLSGYGVDDDLVMVDSVSTGGAGAGSGQVDRRQPSPPLPDVDSEYRYDDADFVIDNYEDDDDIADQEYYDDNNNDDDDDDDDARSDTTVMPEKDEVEAAMQQDSLLRDCHAG